MGASPIPFIFTQLWLLCAPVRPSIDEEAWATLVRSYPKTRKARESLNPSAGPQSSKSSAARRGKESYDFPSLNFWEVRHGQAPVHANSRTLGTDRFCWRARRPGQLYCSCVSEPGRLMEFCARGLCPKIKWTLRKRRPHFRYEDLRMLEDFWEPKKSHGVFDAQGDQFTRLWLLSRGIWVPWRSAGEAARAAARPGPFGRGRSMSLGGHWMPWLCGAEDSELRGHRRPKFCSEFFEGDDRADCSESSRQPSHWQYLWVVKAGKTPSPWPGGDTGGGWY